MESASHSPDPSRVNLVASFNDLYVEYTNGGDSYSTTQNPTNISRTSTSTLVVYADYVGSDAFID